MATLNYGDIIRDTTSAHWNVRDEFKNNDIFTNKAICEERSLPFSIGMVNVAGDLNIGMMIRTASLLGAEAIHIFGRRKYDRRSTVGAENYIDIHNYVYDNPLECGREIVQDLRILSIGHDIVLVEHGGTPITDPQVYTGVYYPLFVFGSESHGLPLEVCEEFDKISIPQRGVLRSYNVASAMSIVGWDYTSHLDSIGRIHGSY